MQGFVDYHHNFCPRLFYTNTAPYSFSRDNGGAYGAKYIFLATVSLAAVLILFC